MNEIASVIVTLKIMPTSPEVELGTLQEKALSHIQAFAGETETKVEEEPVAFGLKCLKIVFVMDEDKGSTEALEQEIAQNEGVNSVEVVDVRRSFG